ncbi:MAG: universal stress protein [Desulfobacterales bacterium]
MMKDARKVLVAVDGSENAMDAVRYAGEILSPKNIRICLCHIHQEIPEAMLDLKNMPGFHHQLAEIGSWRIQNKQKMDAFMTQAKETLADVGFTSKEVKTIIRKKRTGIAGDILEEAKDGYHAVFAGRRGLSRIKDLLIGGTANKLVGKAMRIPVVVVGRLANASKVIVAFDGSKNAFKAVDRLAGLANPDKCEVEICHVIRSISSATSLGDVNVLPVEVEDTWMKESIRNIKPLIADAKKRLIKSGFEPEKVSVKILTHKPSRAFAIVEEAEAGEFGTIVVGRRGLTLVQEFTMGRVGKKIVHAATDHSVWVVG